MKNSIIILSVLLSASLLSNELSWVDEQVQAIKPARNGMDKRSVAVIRDPFIFLEKNRLTKREKNTTSVSPSPSPIKRDASSTTHNTTTKTNNVYVANAMLSLEMIINSSVMINREWYKVGDTVSGYTIKKINHNSVLLVKNNKKLLLSTRSDSKKLKFQK